MVESNTVLWGQTIVYTCYCLAIISLVGWFALKVTSGVPGKVSPKVFYAWVATLALIGVSLHLVTYNTIPWVAQDLHAADAKPVVSYDISVADHKFTLPSEQLDVPCDKLVKFSVESGDLTYGFGVFRPDNSMVMQMQVVPGHPNDLLWTFSHDGTYSIRSTEYSGPAGFEMVVPDAIRVSGCGTES